MGMTTVTQSQMRVGVTVFRRPVVMESRTVMNSVMMEAITVTSFLMHVAKIAVSQGVVMESMMITKSVTMEMALTPMYASTTVR
jgi:hypothetical protein